MITPDIRTYSDELSIRSNEVGLSGRIAEDDAFELFLIGLTYQMKNVKNDPWSVGATYRRGT